MKKLVLISLLFLSVLTNAQTLENTYSSTVYLSKTKSNEMVYTNWTPKTKTMLIYDLNHKLITSIKANIKDTASGAGQVTRTLFNTDNSFEFIVNAGKNFYIIGEDGNVKFSKMGDANTLQIFAMFYNTPQGTKMIVNYVDNKGSYYKAEVYSLAGMLLNKKEEIITDLNMPYPNPTSEFITLETGKKNEALIEVYNGSGQVVDSFKAIGLTRYDATKLLSGIYYYNVDGIYAGNFIKD